MNHDLSKIYIMITLNFFFNITVVLILEFFFNIDFNTT